jgi:hypothetical protein
MTLHPNIRHQILKLSFNEAFKEEACCDQLMREKIQTPSILDFACKIGLQFSIWGESWNMGNPFILIKLNEILFA